MLSKTLDKFNINNNDNLDIGNNGNEKIFINQYKLFALTKPLLCFRKYGVHIHNDTIKFFS